MPKYRRAIATTAWLLVAASTEAIAQRAGQFAFDVKSEPLSHALRDVALQSGTNIVAPDSLVGARQAPALSGTYTVEQALAKLLQGTGLQYRAVGNSLVIEASSFPDTFDAAQLAGSPAITVTGTRIRGAGSASPVTVTTRRQLEQAGISNLADFTRILPQNYTGGQNPGVAGGGEQGGQENTNNSATLNLRGLGPDATLTLLNGHRLSYDGVDQGIDISAIPLAAIDRIEVVSDGASALYGSDAVSGVANIILRRDYEGLETDARFGGATSGGDFQQEYSLVGGHRWGAGGFMIALDASKATPITAGQRDYTRSLDPSLFLMDRTRQYSSVLSFHEQIAPGLSFELDGNLMDRRSLVQRPFLPGQDLHVSGIIDHSHVTSYALTPNLRASLGPWQLSLSATGSDSRSFLDAYNYNNGVPVHSHILYEDNLKGTEATGEGPLFALPGGSARLAVGAGLRTIWFHDRVVTLSASQDITARNFTPVRSVQFAYGELSLPLVGPDLHFPLVERLTFSAALRHERWKAIASVTTPKFGLIYQPVSWVTVRATWGKSFKIPTLYQIYQSQAGALYPGSYFTPPPVGGRPILVLAGSAPNLKPERATSWSTTVELKPRFMPGFQFGATYFHIDFRDRIAKPLSTAISALYNPLYNNLITYNPTAAQVDAAIAPLTGGLFNFTGAPFDPSGVSAIIDESTRNTERQRIHGVDLDADYRLDSGPGSRLTLTGAASYLQSQQQLVTGQPLLPLAGTIFHPPHWRGRAGIVWDKNQTGLSAFVNYLGPTIDNTFRTVQSVPAFITLDLSASLRPKATTGLLSNVELRVSALNVLNEEPHHIRSHFPETVPYDSTNESPVGRFISASLRKVW